MDCYNFVLCFSPFDFTLFAKIIDFVFIFRPNSQSTDDEKFIQAINDQIKSWPTNFNIKDLTGLILRIRKGATKVMLTIAEIAEQSAWCHNLLELVLQEIYILVNEKRQCPILSDVLEQNSQALLISTSVSKSLIKRQTAIRLILLASGQSTHIYHHSVTELLAYTNHSENMNSIEALIRLMSGANYSNENAGLKPGITIALERLLIDEFKMEDDSIERNLNVLQNLLFLVRYVRSALSHCLLIPLPVLKFVNFSIFIWIQKNQFGKVWKFDPFEGVSSDENPNTL